MGAGHPLFHLLGPNVTHEEANRIFGVFGDVFELYARRILDWMYSTCDSTLAKRLSLDVNGLDQEGHHIQLADACLNDVTEVVLFEMKAVFVRESETLSLEYEQYLAHLRKKYGVISEGSDRPKGVAQLARSISKLATDEWQPLDSDFSRAERFYPVLLVHDVLLGAPLHPNFLASEFQKALQPDQALSGGLMQKGRFQVAALIEMTIEDLENLETSVDRFSLRELLHEYSDHCPDRMDSLHDFIASSRFGKMISPSKTVAAKSLELIEKANRQLFPTQPDE